MSITRHPIRTIWIIVLAGRLGAVKSILTVNRNERESATSSAKRGFVELSDDDLTGSGLSDKTFRCRGRYWPPPNRTSILVQTFCIYLCFSIKSVYKS